eukprot:TRINITY_DN27781_c0_g1_i1.p1 TRINITY_DN27781_c0_g1~~TRINITY_DN27781_c0_g1_i1.p1  ORF type:complete len:518 (-),score=62.58 TRINITY_DN27781_c0_g1_i1:47-1600(-)
MARALAGPAPQTRIECYDRVRVLGRGSYGTAVLVRVTGDALRSRSRTSGNLRVMKEVDLDRVDEKQRAEALREAELLKSLSHPNIIAYDEAFLVETRLCIVMEYADGGDLFAAIERRKTENKRYHEREVMAIFSQLALALEFIHSRRVLHRDLKSQNVFLMTSGVPKIGDFGISRVLNASEICADTQIGTPQNLPPEMCDNHPYDFKADIWCLGIILYEMVALEAPFSASSVAALVMKICTTEPAPIPAVYSGEVRTLLTRMLSKRPDDRPSSSEVIAYPHVRRGTPSAARLATRSGGTLGAVKRSVSTASSDATIGGTFSPHRAGNDEAAGKAAALRAATRITAIRALSCDASPYDEASPVCDSDIDGMADAPSSGRSRQRRAVHSQPRLPPVLPQRSVAGTPGTAAALAAARAPAPTKPLGVAGETMAWVPASGRVTSAEIAELGIHLDGADALSPQIGRPASRAWLSSSPTSPEKRAWLSSSPTSPEKFNHQVPELSASCSLLLREIERELNIK